MRIYTVHVPFLPTGPNHAEAVLIKESFSWLGFFFSVFWALWHRLWFVALGIVLLNALIGLLVVLIGLDQLSQMIISFGIAVLIGFTANDLRRWTLARKGFDQVAVIAAEDDEMALARYLASLVPPPQLTPSPLPTSGPILSGVAE